MFRDFFRSAVSYIFSRGQTVRSITSKFLKCVFSRQILLLVWLPGLFLYSCSAQQTYQNPQRLGRDVSVEVDTLVPNVPAFFTCRYHGKKINFFVIKEDNKVVSFLDACSRCYPAKRGYRCEGGSIVCRECNVRYSLSQIEKGIGGCFPIRVEGSVRDGRYLIPLRGLKGSRTSSDVTL